ncbi:MAG: HlyD family secretion protein [Gammaproteobacteria bacterium]|nr:MAG: HlyD family secretion protein [Gammaproteobacteria bacterium]
MSETEESTDKQAPQPEADKQAQKPEKAGQEEAPRAVKRGGMVIAVVIILSLGWYLVSDRYTPYTTQARVQGYVIGVAPQVAGKVIEVYAKNNERVEAGQALFKIDPTQYEIALDKAQSDYANALRQVEAGGAGVDAARANLESVQANLVKAQKDTSRLERLYKEDPGTISTRRLEVSRATLEQSQAQVKSAEAQIEQAIQGKGGDSLEENTILRTARTAIEKANLDLKRTVVKATDRGEITDLRVDVGHYAGTGAPVITLISLSDVWIQAEYTENNLGHLKTGTPVEILFDSLPGSVYEGMITNIGLGVSAGQAPAPGTLPTVDNNRDWLRQSQRFQVLVRFDMRQKEGLMSQLRIGGQASVMAYTEQASVTRTLARLYIRAMSVMSYAY